ncbi:MAG: zinc-dependent metalloprotease [Actinomycetota bacterium]
MSDPGPGGGTNDPRDGGTGGFGGFGFGPGGDPEAFADTPLFREIQRVMSSSDGPINWELARQVGIATAQEGKPDPEPTDEDRATFEGAVRVAELQIGELTGLEPPTDVARVRPVRRATWVEENLTGLRELLEPAADRVSDALATQQGGGDLAAQLPEELRSQLPPGFEQQLQQAMTMFAPLMMGTQVGQTLGFLGQNVMGQYDVAVPRPGPGALLFVVPNIARFEADWSLPPTDFRTLIAIHEVTHRFEFARPWAASRFRELLEDFLSTMQIDAGELQQRMAGIDMSDPEAMRRAVEDGDGLFGTVLDDEQRLKLGRIQAFMAAAEGYGDHVMYTIGRSLLSSYARIEEAMRRYRESEVHDPVFERLLGIEMKRDQYRQGRAFCDTVVELTDEATLTTMWDSPEAMPSLPEIEEPRLWLARSA